MVISDSNFRGVTPHYSVKTVQIEPFAALCFLVGSQLPTNHGSSFGLKPLIVQNEEFSTSSSFETKREVIVDLLSDAEVLWESYLTELSTVSDPVVPKNVIDGIRQVRSQIHGFLGRTLDPPQAGPGSEGMQLIWDDGNEQLLVEVTHEDTLHWFYKNRSNGRISGGEGLPTDKFPPTELQPLLQSWKAVRTAVPYARIQYA
jgi:hypothetical protein